jgi:hypothetical protein
MGALCKQCVRKRNLWFTADTHTKRQATQHGCLPCLQGDRDKGIEIVYGGEKEF